MLTEVEKALAIGENMISWCYHLVFTICLVLCEELEIQEDKSSYSQEAQNLLNQGRHHMSGERHCFGQKNRALWEGSKHFRCGDLCLPEALAWLEGRGYWRVVGSRAG